jgi:hypothetical protein
MTLRWYYSVDASTVLEITGRVRLPRDPENVAIGVGAHAEEGSGWQGVLNVDDPAGDLVMLMHRRIYCVQDAEAAGNQVVGNWFIVDLDVVRMDPWSATSRTWIVTMADENSLLSRRIFVGTDNDRPAETDIARIRWMLTTTEMNTVDRDEAFIDTTGAVDMDAVDYLHQKPEQVMSDVSQQSGKNYWIKYSEAAAVGGAIVSSSVADPSVITTTSAHGLTSGMSIVIAGHTGSTPDINGTHVVTVLTSTTYSIPIDVTVGGTGGTSTTVGRYVLCYFPSNSELYVSALSLSNDATEIDSSTVFAISDDTRLSRAGGRSPVSGMDLTYDGGYKYVQDTTVGDTYVYRDVAAPAVNVKTAVKAETRAKRLLAELDEPEDEVETEIVVQAAQVNDVMHGMRIPLKATHLPNYTAASSMPGYSSGTDMRIMRRQLRQIGPTTFGNRLWMRPIPPSCPSPTPTGSFYPLGGNTATKTPNASTDGNVLYLRPGITYPRIVSPGHVGSWHFATYQAGGIGTVDEAGNCAQNELRLIVVGDGTMTIHMVDTEGAQNFLAKLYHADGVAEILDSTTAFAADTDVVIPISSHGQEFCTHWVAVRDNGPACGHGWGFAGMDWVAS